MADASNDLAKTPTGIAGLDQTLRGGLPAGRTTLITGGPGTGKTVLALQSLVHGARELDEPGVFIAFEETVASIKQNAASFGWDLDSLGDDRLCLIDAKLDHDLVRSGTFDFDGLLAALQSKVDAMGAKRIAFDAIDMLMALLPEARQVRSEMFKLRDWLTEHDLTALVTQKTSGQAARALDFVEFMIDCLIELHYHTDQGVSHRDVKVVKMRGSAFDENAVPFVFSDRGMVLALSHSDSPASAGESPPSQSGERVSSGVQRLDSMLGGGFFRGSGVLITGRPGTAKTTLCGAFCEAAAARGERSLMVSFDSRPGEIVRNLKSVGIDLQPGIDADRIRFSGERSIVGSAEHHFVRIQQLVEAFGAVNVVIDPLSALAHRGNRRFAPGVIQRLVDWCKMTGRTLVASSLIESDQPGVHGTPLAISTIADTWIHLEAQDHAGERNRSLSVIKSRGMAHSLQVREMLLSDDGVELADVYTATGEVLMGTLREQRERADRLEADRERAQRRRKRALLEAEAAQIEAEFELMKRRLEAKRVEIGAAEEEREREDEAVRRGQRETFEARGGDGADDA